MTTLPTIEVHPGVLPTIPGNPGVGSLRARTVSPAPYATAEPVYVLEVVDTDGQHQAMLTTAVVANPRRSRNGSGDLSITCHRDDPGFRALVVDNPDGSQRLATFHVRGQVRLWRNGAMAEDGWYIVDDEAAIDLNTGEATFHANGWLALFDGLDVGEREIRNVLPAAASPSIGPWWLQEGTGGAINAVLPDDTAPSGDNVALVMAGTGDEDSTVDLTSYGTTYTIYRPGLWYSAKATIWIDEDTDLQRDRIFTVTVYDPDTLEVLSFADFDDQRLEQITANTRTWQTITLPFYVPGQRLVRVQVRCYNPYSGSIRYSWQRTSDGRGSWVAALRNEAVVTPEGGQDVATFCQRIVQYAQDPFEGYWPAGIGTAGELTGELIDHQLTFADGPNIGQAIRTLWVDAGRGDYAVVCAPTSKTFTFWPGGRNDELTEWPIIWCDAYGKRDYIRSVERIAWQGADIVTDPRVKGDGDGFVADQARARNRGWTGGMVRSGTYRADAGLPLKELQLQADNRAASFGAVRWRLRVVMAGAFWTAGYCGQRLRCWVDLADGWALDGEWAAIEDMVLDPHADTVQVDLVQVYP